MVPIPLPAASVHTYYLIGFCSGFLLPKIRSIYISNTQIPLETLTSLMKTVMAKASYHEPIQSTSFPLSIRKKNYIFQIHPSSLMEIKPGILRA